MNAPRSDRSLFALLVLALVCGITGCPSKTLPVKPDDALTTDAGTNAGDDAGVDAGVTDAGEVDAGPPAPPPDAGQAQNDTVVPAGGNDTVETPEEKAGREAREKEEAEKKTIEEKRAAEEAAAKAKKTEIDGALADAGKFVVDGQSDAAIKAYQELVQKYPDSPIPHYNMGVIYDRLGMLDRAVTEYKTALQMKPDLAVANDNLDRLYIRTGRIEEAEDNARRIPSAGASVDAKNQLVRVLIAKGDLAGAESLAKAVLKQDERNTDAMLSLGEIWYQQKKYELSKKVLGNARDIDPNVPEVWNLLAFVYQALDLRPSALEAFKHAASLREDFPEAHNNLGAMLNEANDCDGATKELELAVKYAPGYAQAHLNLGNAYRCSRRYDEAEKQYKRTLELDPHSIDALFNLAILYLDGEMKLDWNKDDRLDSDKMERLKKAKDYFDQYRAAGGDDPRLDRYSTEAEKDIGKEQYRLAHNEEMRIKKEKYEADKKMKEEEAKKRKEEAMAKIEAAKVNGKEDIEDEPPTPQLAPQTVMAPPQPSPGEPAPAPVPPPQVEAALPVQAATAGQHMQKIGTKEDEPDNGP